VATTFWVYIMASRSGTLYIGITSELEIRVRQHKVCEIEGFAAKYNCTRLVCYESFDKVVKAIAREKQLKGWRRSKKVALIEKVNPHWEDLAEKWGAEVRFAAQAIS
jgi:putative endonuclease